jgi:glucan phosphorylase
MTDCPGTGHNVRTSLAKQGAICIEGRTVSLRAWHYAVHGFGGFTVPVYFLDADLPDNTAWDRTLTHTLYGGAAHYRLCQEIVLGRNVGQSSNWRVISQCLR